MNTLVLEHEPIAVDIEISEAYLIIRLEDGRTLSIPLEWYPRLYYASIAERNHWQFLGGGYAIEWPDLDEYIGIEGLIAGRRSGESQASFEKWLKTRQ